MQRIERWPRCTCMTCLALDIRYPNEGYQLAFWRYEKDAAPGPFTLRRLKKHLRDSRRSPRL